MKMSFGAYWSTEAENCILTILDHCLEAQTLGPKKLWIEGL